MTDTDGSGHIVEQNMLSSEVSAYILIQLKPSIIVTGHDHHGCASIHLVNVAPQIMDNDPINPEIHVEELRIDEDEPKISPNENELDNLTQEPSVTESETHTQHTESQIEAEVKSDSTQRFVDLTEEYVDSDNILEHTQDSTSPIEESTCLETPNAEEHESITSEQEIPVEIEEKDGVPDLSIDVEYNLTTIPYNHSEYLYNIERNLTSVTLELTIRSIMGDYGGNLGLLEVYKTSTGAWNYHYADCPYFDHLVIRIICITNLVTLLVVIAIGTYTGLGLFLPRTKKIKTM
ncbi:hypothetical protein K7432_017699 [Basidiobolus ranarum]